MKLILVLITAASAIAQSPQARVYSAISRVENCAKWNNPGCLKFAAQAGARRGPGGYAVFARLEQGQAALRAKIASAAGKTVLQFLKEYNPGVRNYPQHVSRLMHLDLAGVL